MRHRRKKTLYLDGAIWGAAAVAAVAALAPAAARAEPRDQWIAAQKEIDAILADWPIAGGADGIRRRIGTVGTTQTV